MDYDLNTCPFCGKNVKEDGTTWMSHDQHHYFSIACPCGAFGPKTESKEKAIMAWNMREYSTCDLFWNPFDFQKDGDAVGLDGNLKSISFSCVLQILSSEIKTGVLQLTHAQKISALCLKDGQVIAASSNYGQPLGQILFDKGLVLWEEGIFQFRDRPIEFDERGIENISVMAMMLDALRITEEFADTRKSNTSSFNEIRIV
jgi:Lar family restriction alleviation protein